jgi:hypothetical protein
MWGSKDDEKRHFNSKLIVAFTFLKDGKKIESALKDPSSGNVNRVLSDAGHRFVEFKRDDPTASVNSLLTSKCTNTINSV